MRTQSEKNGDNHIRWNEKLRLRFGLAVKINPELNAEIRIATARSNRSTNQGLGDSSEPAGTRHFIGLDLAYVNYHPVSFAKLYAGRIPQLHFRPGGSQVILDEDISLEGTALSSEYMLNEQWRVFLNAGSVYIRENYDSYYSVDRTDNMINWAQAGAEWKIARLKLTAGAGFFNFTGLQGKNYSDLVTGGTPNGNTEGPTGSVKYPYLPRQYFLEGLWSEDKTSFSLFSERVINNEVSDGNSAWWLGAGFTRNSWDGQAAYCEVKPDAVPALFTFSDFANGTADARGVVLSARWKFAKGMSFKVTEFLNRIQASTNNKQYNRTHLDLNLTF